MTLKGILFGACACCLTLLVSAASTPHRASADGLTVGDVLPKMKSLDVGGRRSLTEAPRQHYTLLHLWAAYDAESRAENVVWDQYFSARPSTQISYRALSLDTDSAVYHRTIALDQVDVLAQSCAPEGQRNELIRSLGLQQGLHTYLVDTQGVVRAVDPTPQELTEYIK